MARMKVKRYPDDAAVFAFLKKSGIDPDEPELTALRFAANVAKHSEGLRPISFSSFGRTCSMTRR